LTKKTCIFVVFVCSLSPSINNYARPSFRSTCAMAWVWTLNAYWWQPISVVLCVINATFNNI